MCQHFCKVFLRLARMPPTPRMRAAPANRRARMRSHCVRSQRIVKKRRVSCGFFARVRLSRARGAMHRHAPRAHRRCLPRSKRTCRRRRAVRLDFASHKPECADLRKLFRSLDAAQSVDGQERTAFDARDAGGRRNQDRHRRRRRSRSFKPLPKPGLRTADALRPGFDQAAGERERRAAKRPGEAPR